MNVLATGLEWFTDRPGGLPRYFAEYLSAWTKHGEEARGLVRTNSEGTLALRPSYVHNLPLNSKNPLKVRNAWRQKFREELKRDHFDVFNPHFAYYAWAWSNLRIDIPTVTHFHGPWAYESLVECVNHPILRRTIEFQLQRQIEKSVYRRSDRFIVLSQYFRDQLVEHYGVPQHRVHVIPGAVDIERFRDAPDRQHVRHSLGIPQDRFVLLTVRRLVRRMGIDNLIKAVHEVRRYFPDILLVVVGGGSLFRELSDLVTDLHLEDHVRLTNRVPDKHLPLYYQAADLTVVPTVALEGFGFVTIESLASGTPVAGTPIGGTKEILEKFDSSLLFNGSTVSDLVAGLEVILSNPRQLPSREITRQHVLDNYTWDIVIPQIRRVFETAGATR